MAGNQNEQQGESHVQEYQDGPAEQQQVQQSVQQPVQSQGIDLPVKEGAVFGAIAAIGTYIMHLLLTVVLSAQVSPATDSSGDPIEMVAAWTAAGWSYLATFGTEFQADGEIATLTTAPNHGAAMGLFVGNTLLFVVSFGAIIAAGYAIATYADADDPVEAVKSGLTVVPPYLVLAIVFALVMTHTYEDGLATSLANSVNGLESTNYGPSGDDLPFGPSLSSAAIYAGIVFPAVFATVGAVLTQWREVRDRILAKVV